MEKQKWETIYHQEIILWRWIGIRKQNSTNMRNKAAFIWITLNVQVILIRISLKFLNYIGGVFSVDHPLNFIMSQSED